MNVRFDVESGPRASFGLPVADGRFQDGPRENPHRHEIPPLALPLLEARDRRRASARAWTGSARCTRRKTGWKPRSRSTPSATTRLRIAPSPPSASTPARASYSTRWAPSSPKRSCSATCPYSRSTRWITTCCVEGARNLRDYFQSQGLLRRPGAVQGAARGQRHRLHRFPDRYRRAPQAGVHRNRRQQLLRDAVHSRAHVPANPPRFSSSRTAGTAKTC